MGRDSFFPDALTLTRTLSRDALSGSAAEAARAFIARLMRPQPKPEERGPVTLLMAAESAQHKRALVRQVLRWHNRHPLARRLTPTDISGFGSASLPFSAPQADGQRFALFDDAELLPGVSTRRLAAFALAHGHNQRPGARHWAQREVGVAPGWNPNHAAPLHLHVVALKLRGRKAQRLLLGRPAEPGDAWPVLGQRIWSTPRVAVAGLLAALPLLGVALALVPLLHRSAPVAEAQPQPVVAAAPAPLPTPMPVPVAQAAQTPAEPVQPAAPLAPPPLPGTPELTGLPIEHATDPLRLSVAAPQAGQRNGPALRLALIGAIGADAPEQIAFQANLRAVLPALGSHTGRLQIDVVGTPDGDAVSVWPFDDEAAAQRVGQALRTRGILMRIAEL